MHDVYQLANLAATFEQIANVPILSVFEYESRSSGQLLHKFFGTEKKVSTWKNYMWTVELASDSLQALVDEQLATISGRTVHMLGMHLSHQELCKLAMLHGDKFSARDFLRNLLQDIASKSL
jgi:hypothetical protein